MLAWFERELIRDHREAIKLPGETFSLLRRGQCLLDKVAYGSRDNILFVFVKIVLLVEFSDGRVLAKYPGQVIGDARFLCDDE